MNDEHNDPDDDLINDDPSDCEVVAHCHSVQQAESMRDLLIDHDILATLEQDDQGEYVSTSEGFGVKVPYNSANEARDIIEELDSIEELDTADPDVDDDGDDDDAAMSDAMQPLEADSYSLDDAEDADGPDLGAELLD